MRLLTDRLHQVGVGFPGQVEQSSNRYIPGFLQGCHLFGSKGPQDRSVEMRILNFVHPYPSLRMSKLEFLYSFIAFIYNAAFFILISFVLMSFSLFATMVLSRCLQLSTHGSLLPHSLTSLMTLSFCRKVKHLVLLLFGSYL